MLSSYNLLFHCMTCILYYSNRDGEDWLHVRQPLQRFAMVPRKVAEYHDGFNQVTEDLLKKIEEMREPETGVLKDVSSPIHLWAFECRYSLHVL